MFYLLGKVYSLRFQELLDYPVTLIFLYYDWAVYDLEQDVYLRAASLS